MKKYWLLLLLPFVGFSCDQEVKETVPMTLNFEFLYDNEPLVLEAQTYTNALGQSITISDFRFYLSNLRLEGEEMFTEKESYHLLAYDLSAEDSIVIEAVPKERYTQLTFAVGIDPERNLSTDNVGDLDPNNGMAWDWNTGYKFLLLEGRYLKEGTQEEGMNYHIGGNDNYRVVTLPITLEEADTYQLKVKVHVDKIFGDKAEVGVTEAERQTFFIDFERNSPEDTMFGPYSQNVANNYALMFSVVND
ncbi:MbnP family protein [Algivirga pacifica]|uniref:Copper-binding protein MbnP-like domain-containing protein n=1 Tax=Algivirga pacifica TaxID=1162670 RepID=A0ABP9D4L0_9BACT